MSKLKEVLERIIENGFICSSDIYHDELCFYCGGHSPGNPSWVIVRMDNIETIEIRKRPNYNEVLIAWQPNGVEDE